MKTSKIPAIAALLAMIAFGIGQFIRSGMHAQTGPVVGQPGVVAAYGFEEGTGTTVADATGNGNTGTASGATWSPSGRFGKALSFNGTSSRVNVPDAGVLDLSIGMTLEAWVNPTSNAGWRTAILKETPTGLAYALYTSDSARPAGYFTSGSSDIGQSGTAALALNTWTHLATTYDGATLRVYVNGALVSSRAATGTILASGNPLRIGGNAVWGEYFAGLIDEVRIYGRALTAAEIQADMNAPVAQGDTVPPTVTAVSPGSGSTGVARTTNVTATFSEAMTASTITGSTFDLRNSSNQLVAASVTYSAATLTATLDPTADLTPGATYTATVHGGATAPQAADASGNLLGANVTWSFTVVPSDTTPPTVAAVTPASGAGAVPVASNITATFSEAMTASSIGTTSFELRNAANQPVAAAVSYNAATFTATLDPSADLAANATYTATVRGGATDPRVKDAADNALAASVSWSFTTAPPPDTTAPAVTATSPASGASSVSRSTNVTVAFSEALGAATIGATTFELRDSGSQVVPATVTYDAATFTATIDPSADLLPASVYTATVRGGATDPRVKDVAGNALAASVSWSFTTALCPCSIWPASVSPVTPDFNDPSGVELGLKFQADRDGIVTGVRFYKGAGNVGPHVGSLWTAGGVRLGFATFGSETATGWQQVGFETPIAITANTTYVVSYYAPAGHYAADGGFFGAAVDNAPLHALATATSANGVFGYAPAAGTFPTQSFNATNYWVDVLYTDIDTAPPAVSSQSPAANATGVGVGTTVAATFNEALNPATISTATFELRTPSNTLVTATVSYNAVSRTAILTPLAPLTGTTLYTARLRGGAAEPRVKDLAGNALAADFAWSFTTEATDTTPPVITTVTPANGSTDVVATTSVSATFSEGMTAATIDASTVELRTAANQLVGAAVTYNAATLTATLTPTAALTSGATYTATVRGGAADPRAKDAAGNALAASVSWSFTIVAAPTTNCPCSIWTPQALPATAAAADSAGVEVGVKFQSDRSGYITGLRFYKGATNSGTHVGSLWTASGTLLTSAIFSNESASGWQQADLGSPVAITANTVYVVSYYAPVGQYSVSGSYFTAAVDNVPLHALANSTSANGVYRYSATGGLFPNQSFAASNYWVDVVFTDVLGSGNAPVMFARAPAAGATNVPLSPAITASFSKDLNPATVTTATVELRNASNALVASTVSYDNAARTITLLPSSPLAPSSVYTVTVRGGATDPRVKDTAGNAMAANEVWSFSTVALPPNDGPGGPILVVASTVNPFGRYYSEILRAEGLNLFTTTDISQVTAATLASYDVVVLAEMPLTSAQVSMLTTWVNAGGKLVAMRPDPQLATLLGLTSAGAPRSDQYLLMDTAGAGAGLVAQTIQYHGPADLYTLNGATAVATLYSSVTVATVNPAVTLRSVGAGGGQAAAFTYDLARSIVYTRQGNPAWQGQERDGLPPVRTDDLFYGGSALDLKPDWIDFTRIGIPQADEQQRLLANLILRMTADRKPLPRFWYLPRGLKAAVVMTGDDHANNGTPGRFDQYKALSPAGCVVDDWQCIRGTSYIYANTPMSDAQAAAYQADGFEVALHVSTNCAEYTPTSLGATVTLQMADWKARYASLASPVSNRTHCAAWSDYATQPKVARSHGIRFDTTYYFYPGAWVQDTPGFFTGSGWPMRFADLDGTTIDVFQAASQMIDESNQTYPFTVNTLLDRALGAEGYYGVFTANMHTDQITSTGSDAIVASAKARGVPVVTSKQMLTWLDGRNGSSFGAMAWSGGTLTFTLTQATGANGLRVMLPAQVATGPLMTLTRNGVPVAFTIETIKGLSYATFQAQSGTWTAGYTAPPDTTITASPAATTTSTSASFSFTATPSAGATFQCSLDNAAFTTCTSPRSYSGLAVGSHNFRVRGVNASGTDASPASFTWTITAPPAGANLVAAYGFEEGSGTTTADSSSAGNTGTLSNATWTTSGRFGKALSFNGTSSWVTVADTNALDLTTAMTLEAWVNPVELSGWRQIVLKEAGPVLAYGLYASSGTVPDAYIHVGPDDLGTAGPAPLPLNTWTHVATTYDGATLRLFINGVQVASSAASGTMTVSSGVLRIGGNAIWDEFFNGRIDEVRIYSRALTAAEITSDMNTAIKP